ncbi:MAG TPA: tRNA (N6-threonylcarbamoyladenosine(37)-N6)-methyltransferase TrmO [Cyclobacteriaceae bacterium]|nr:tRNA (N6-threonylcarbamoyladenosine(37)-N6)-methyltransferase TrmO [Cyclobacteriaceae bacterium]
MKSRKTAHKNTMRPTIQFIGAVHSSLKKIDDCPLQENENAPGAEIEISPAFIDGIRDLQVGSEILLLTWLHKADRKVIECVPRNNYDAPMVGVFSTRSPDRPNPIGIHTAKVLAIDNGSIKVSALEVLDQTPVIDIKPIIKRSSIS